VIGFALILLTAIAFAAAGMFLAFLLGKRAGGATRRAQPAHRVEVRPGEAHLVLAGRWGRSDPELAPTSNADDFVADVEQRYGISIPEDFRFYLLNVAPSGYYMDEIGTTWWTLADIKNIPDECGEAQSGDGSDPAIVTEAKQYLIFADFLVWCYAWAICCSDGEHRGKVALITNGGADQFVADSFSHFVQLELNDAAAIHGIWPK
jgi:hypothetical protein